MNHNKKEFEMGKLHELVAVEKDVRGTANKIIAETGTTFTKKAHLFSTHSKLYEPFKEGDQDVPEQELPTPITTVDEKLEYFEKHLARLLDVVVQKEDANTKAKGDIEILLEDSTVIPLLKNVPVQALVQLENLLENLRSQVYDAIPTLDPAKTWIEDKAAGKGRYLTDATTRVRTNKIQKPITLHPGTDKHPPQVQLINDDVPVGNWKITYFSGLLSPAQKSEVLGRIDVLIASIKKARARANDTLVDNGFKIGKRLFQFINDGK
jgi:hypothetical protein